MEKRFEYPKKTSENAWEFVRNLPHDTQLHNLYEAEYTLSKWRCEFGDRIPEWMNGVILFCGHILDRLGSRFRDVDLLEAWIDQSNTYTSKIQFVDLADVHWEFLVEPDGVFSRRLLKGQVSWSDWTRETR